MRIPKLSFPAALLLSALGSICQAQYWGINNVPVVNPWDSGTRLSFPGSKFTFARIRYRGHRGNWSWRTDYPESDLNFSMRLSELTTIEVNRDELGRIIHVVVDLIDDRIFDYPFLYMVEVGYLDLNDYEAQRLRIYLLRGGFLHVDDFWDDREWANWEYQIRKVFPEKDQFPIVEIPLHHEIFHCVFDLEEVPQVPSINAWINNRSTSDRPGLSAHFRGIFDEEGRLMVAMTFNTDLGDGWEREGENYEYFQRFSVAKAYPLGINIVVYALTH